MAVQNIKNWFHERLVPDALPWYNRKMYYDHVARYNFAAKFVKNKKVLDIACGSGYGSYILAEAKVNSIIGADISKEAVDYAKRRYPHKLVKFIVGDATKIPLNNNSIDIVVSFETLEHVKNYRKFIGEVKRVLKKGGLLIISTPNRLLGTKSANPFHIKEFSLNEFKNLLNENFTIVKMYGQKPVHVNYLKIVNRITNVISPGLLRWLVDTIFKIFFRATRVTPLDKFKWGFSPSYFIGLARKR